VGTGSSRASAQRSSVSARTVAAQGALTEAGTYLERARYVYGRALGNEHFETLGASELLADNLELRNKFAEAEVVRREVLKTRQAVLRSRFSQVC